MKKYPFEFENNKEDYLKRHGLQQQPKRKKLQIVRVKL